MDTIFWFLHWKAMEENRRKHDNFKGIFLKYPPAWIDPFKSNKNLNKINFTNKLWIICKEQ